jgi:DNA mismatch endonuclease, patch repair protein
MSNIATPHGIVILVIYHNLQELQNRKHEICLIVKETRMNARSRKTPSFSGLSPASHASSHAKKMNRGSDTVHERMLRTLLWKLGLRYRKNVRKLPGKPDIVFPGARVVVFCDGDFWHGRDWQRLSRKLGAGANASYWIPKIRANRIRDRQNDRLLKRERWIVIRIWETDIHRDPHQAARMVADLVRRSSRGSDAIH